MAIDFVALKSELDSDPLSRGYAGLNDQQAAEDLNTAYRDGPADPQALLQYITLERFRTGTLYGRLLLVATARPTWDGAALVFPPLPLGVSDADISVTQKHINAAASLLRYMDVDTQSTVSLLDSRFDSILDNLGTAGGGCDALGSQDKTNIQALSQNRQTRAFELGFTRIKAADVATARAL